MARSVPNWVGKTPDTAIPKRVIVRVFEKFGGRCAECERKINAGAGDKFQIDHIQAMVNGGANSEGNLQLLCDWCHKGKTRSDVAQKATTARIKAKNMGIKGTGRKIQSRGFPKPTHRYSRAQGKEVER